KQTGEVPMLTRSYAGQSMVYQAPPKPTERSLLASVPVTNAAGLDLNTNCGALTPRQREVLAVMMQGKSNKAICRALNLAEPTVKNHVTAIFKALNVTNRTEAVLKVAKASGASVSAMSYAYTVTGYP